MNPYLLDGPAIIAFSGGRTSGMMLYRIIEAHGGALPDDVVPVFCNTGKEHDATLDFVQECAERWGVRIRWIEYVDADRAADRWREVDYATASRDGEPFAAVIRRKGYLPNPVTRFCTIEMKISATTRFAKTLSTERFTKVVGLRADERHRVARARERERESKGKDGFDLSFPLYDAGATVSDVIAFWNVQPFDLRLPSQNGVTPLGNCDLCFLKGPGKIAGILAAEPSRGEWWAAQERAINATFRIDRPSYAAMIAQRNLAFEPLPDTLDCACTD